MQELPPKFVEDISTAIVQSNPEPASFSGAEALGTIQENAAEAADNPFIAASEPEMDYAPEPKNRNDNKRQRSPSPTRRG